MSRTAYILSLFAVIVLSNSWSCESLPWAGQKTHHIEIQKVRSAQSPFNCSNVDEILLQSDADAVSVRELHSLSNSFACNTLQNNTSWPPLVCSFGSFNEISRETFLKQCKSDAYVAMYRVTTMKGSSRFDLYLSLKKTDMRPSIRSRARAEGQATGAIVAIRTWSESRRNVISHAIKQLLRSNKRWDAYIKNLWPLKVKRIKGRMYLVIFWARKSFIQEYA